jgi:stage V sporulation protein B
MAASSVPALTASFGKGDMVDVRRKLNAATRFVMIIAFPSAVGLAVLAKPIFTLLFPGTISTLDIASMMMYLGAVAVVFYSLSTLSNGLLQGINRLRVPVINALIALVAHVILLVVLMLFFRLNIFAVVIANAFFALIMCVLNAVALAKYSGYHQELLKTFLIPAICSGIMGLAAFLVYKGVYALVNSNLAALVPAMAAAVILYGILMLVFKGMTEADLKRLPKGELLIRVAKKAHLL